MDEWEQDRLESFERRFKWHAKKRPKELEATLKNLEKLFGGLQAGIGIRQLMAMHRFLHPEQAGVIAVDQKGGARNLAETRLYVFADEVDKVLYLITIGDKRTQADDVQFCKEFVDDLRKRRVDEQK